MPFRSARSPRVPAALPPSVVELPGPFRHELVHTRGLRLHAAVAGEPGDPLVVLLHGALGGWFEFRRVIAPLAARGVHVAAVDARGYGLSDKPPATAGDDLRTAAGDIAGFIRALGHDRAVVVGADTGGTVAWALAALYPDLVAGLVSVSAAHPVDLRRAVVARPWLHGSTVLRPVWARLGDSAYRRHLAAATTPEFRGTHAFRDELDLRLRASRIGNTRPAVVRASRLPLAASRWGDTRVAAPTLLVQPRQSLWRHLARRSLARVDAPVDVLHVPGTRALPHVENPAGFVDAVDRFLGTLPGA